MPSIRHFFLIALAMPLFAPLVGRAQAAYTNDNWIPQGMDALGSRASFHTDFTFDPQMLRLASGLTGDEETQRIVAKLRGISVHVYRYSEPGLYDPAVLETVRMQYRDRGWKHLVADRSNPESMNPGRTDLWIRYAHDNVEGMVLLLENPTNLDLIAINGTLSPLDLMHLRGHFGIPRDQAGNFGGDHFVPDNR
jgi:Domain of unknown function (DUF4252)